MKSPSSNLLPGHERIEIPAYLAPFAVYVNRTLASPHRDENKLCERSLTTEVHKSQHWLCHWFLQTQTIKNAVYGTSAQEMSLILQNVIAFYRTRTITYAYRANVIFPTTFVR